jgi:hypothetical protein
LQGKKSVGRRWSESAAPLTRRPFDAVQEPEMTGRDRFHAIMSFQPFDRLPVFEWAGWWNLTLDRWHEEGLPRSLTDRYEICRHFGLDIFAQQWFNARRETCPSPASHGRGIIACAEDYERLRPHLYPEPRDALNGWAETVRRRESDDAVTWFTVDGFFWFPRSLLGIERHMYALYDMPELIHRINTDLADWLVRLVEEVTSIGAADFMTFAEDMSYNHGPMLSREMFDEFMRPYYDRVVPVVRSHETIAVVDSDGDITVPAAWFEDAGIEGILPLERQSGVDVARLRREHPRMRFIGHFDKMVMNRGEAAMRAEFERLLPSAARGGFLIGCDHQTPPGVSYEDYRLYLRLFREYAARAGEMSQQCHD